MIAADDFERAELGTAWGRIRGYTLPVLAQGMAVSRSGVAGAYRIGACGPDQFSQGEFGFAPHSGLRVRQDSDKGSAYYGIAGLDGDRYYAGLVKVIGRENHQLAETFPATVQPHVRLEIRGSVLRLLHGPTVEGPWEELVTDTDETLKVGSPGFAVWGGGSVAQWRGGDL